MIIEQIVIRYSMLGAVAMAGIFALLVIRRWLSERVQARRSQDAADITRFYLQRVAGRAGAEVSPSWTLEKRLAVVLDIQGLLRGEERDRLMQITEIDGLLISVMRKSRSVSRNKRIAAIHVFQRLRSGICIGRLRELMASDRSRHVRMEAAFALAAAHNLAPPLETMRMLGLLDKKPTPIDAALMRASAAQYFDQVVTIVENDLPSSWHACLIEALSLLGKTSVLKLVECAAKNDDAEVRCAAMRASVNLGHPMASRWIIPCLNDDKAEVRVQAANACARLGLLAAAPTLAQLANDEDVWVRLRSQEALALTGAKHANRQGAVA